MSEQTNAELIAEARKIPEEFKSAQLPESAYLEDDALAVLDAVGYQAAHIARRLADALEAEHKRAEDAEGEMEGMVDLDSEFIHRLETQRDQLAAVIEKVREEVEAADGVDVTSQNLIPVLASAPQEVLRERDAALIEELVDEFESGSVDHGDLRCPTPDAPLGWTNESIETAIEQSGPIMDWLREKARQRREEQGDVDL